jgi:short subunit dehydrogenase-like uncharacterized protein
VCGFDSVPSDLGAFLAAEALTAEYPGCSLARMSHLLGDSSGGFSGGTIESGFNLLRQFPADELAQMSRPFYLNPRDRVPPVPEREEADIKWPRYDPLQSAWAAPFVMGPINTRVVRRSNALLGFRYGSNLRFLEAMKLPNFIGEIYHTLRRSGSFVTLTHWGHCLAETDVPVS